MKTCVKCQTEQPLENFSKSKNKDGKSSWCKKCVSVARMRRYYENRDVERENGNRRNKEAYLRNKQKVWKYLETHPCVDCGQADFRVLEFDHIEDNKEANIADLLRSKHRWEPIQEEIDKCEVRCANCHRIRGYEQFGWATP